MISKNEEVDVEVTWEDQQSICRFSNLYQLNQEDSEKISALETIVKQLEDAMADFDEYELSSDEEGPLRVYVGEMFSHVDLDEAKQMVTRKLDENRTELAKLKGKRAERTEELTKLKGELQAKFKNSINLEE
ncbi:uncharacterized protein MONOS_9199 [Monocercomonoides exilis]|uniref:uncharacterized protein n=1 Tax=Monocercomonoides exilis TaxID=2049356 RepID=UPI00355A0FB7|nr:hypothetical protein MONOS_9199 [Monocercomonoides exilis]|eukprot:MONOS_9199.1-p1 / transcript=MONOS_9199.1 / gene=MONOS_9199 / organism=Monocercomonoides_exilis_PA203 / gene_product=unspecified product / transcript_product=unspecified product / location=Mono_scaffold00371:13663-14229(+) / protein_length=131 / sequence_SO=supercontig / SO=protein_coding / is_pseudo=false